MSRLERKLRLEMRLWLRFRCFREEGRGPNFVIWIWLLLRSSHSSIGALKLSPSMSEMDVWHTVRFSKLRNRERSTLKTAIRLVLPI